MNLEERLPALRPVDITPMRDEQGDTHFVLIDRSQIAPSTVAVSPAGYFVLAHLDGTHTCADIQAEFQRQVGLKLPPEQVFELVEALDANLLLQGPRYEAAYAARVAAYRASPTRDNRDRYPDAGTLRAELEALIAQGRAVGLKSLHGLIAPHLDYPRGAPCYADAYANLAAAELAERYVILGTNHAGRAQTAVVTGKDFATPLGIAKVDQDFLARLEQRVGGTLREHELDHAWEHSVELQVHFLQVLAGGRKFAIVPILCANPCHEGGACCGQDGDGHDPGGARAFAAALGEVLATTEGRTIVIAGADLSHIGQHFGDAAATTPEYLQRVEQLDRGLLARLESRDEEAVVQFLTSTQNQTRICGIGPIYGLMRALPERECRVLSYHQAISFETETHVTCAAAVLY